MMKVRMQIKNSLNMRGLCQPSVPTLLVAKIRLLKLIAKSIKLGQSKGICTGFTMVRIEKIPMRSEIISNGSKEIKIIRQPQ